VSSIKAGGQVQEGTGIQYQHDAAFTAKRTQFSLQGAGTSCGRSLYQSDVLDRSDVLEGQSEPVNGAPAVQGGYQSHSGNMAATRSLVHFFWSMAHSKLRVSGDLPGTAMLVATE
jgi:hypothetical protein